MKHAVRTLVLCAFLSGVCGPLAAAPVEYVKICSLYGAGFLYLPGTDTCHSPANGDTRQATTNGVWRSRLPYPTGRWAKNVRECAGRMVRIGTFQNADFTLNAWGRKQTVSIPLAVGEKEYISEVMMSGGFYDPRRPGNRSGSQGFGSTAAFCVRSLDPAVPEVKPEPNPEDPPTKERFANGLLPIACISNSRILGMPASYIVDADTSYPSVEFGFADAEETEDYGPFVYNSHVAVTTDFPSGNANLLTYLDAADGLRKPLAGSITVSVCVAKSLDGLR